MPSYRKSAVTLALLSSVFGAQAAFAPQTSVTSSAAISSALKSPTALNGIDSPTTPPEDIAPDFFQKYGEGSRFYRRTVYTHDDWVRLSIFHVRSTHHDDVMELLQSHLCFFIIGKAQIIRPILSSNR